MLIYKLYKKVMDRWDILHTKMLGKILGDLGNECYIHNSIRLGHPERIFIGNCVEINRDVSLSCIVDEHFGVAADYLNGEIHIGERCTIESGVQISAASKLVIGFGCGISRNVIISDHAHPASDPNSLNKSRVEIPLTVPKPVTLEDCVLIGACSIITPGVTVGKGSTVGFGSVVTKSVPPFSVVTGNPAKIISRYDFEQNKWVICRRKL